MSALSPNESITSGASARKAIAGGELRSDYHLNASLNSASAGGRAATTSRVTTRAAHGSAFSDPSRSACLRDRDSSLQISETAASSQPTRPVSAALHGHRPHRRSVGPLRRRPNWQGRQPMPDGGARRSGQPRDQLGTHPRPGHRPRLHRARAARRHRARANEQEQAHLRRRPRALTLPVVRFADTGVRQANLQALHRSQDRPGPERRRTNLLCPYCQRRRGVRHLLTFGTRPARKALKPQGGAVVAGSGCFHRGCRGRRSVDHVPIRLHWRSRIRRPTMCLAPSTALAEWRAASHADANARRQMCVKSLLPSGARA